MKKILLFAAVTLVTFFAAAQKPFQGKITYSVDVTGENADMMRTFMFTGYEFYYSKDKMRVDLQGGLAMMFGYFIVDGSSQKSYMINDEEQVAYDMSNSEGEPIDEGTKEIILLEGTEKIMGYTCSKYKVTEVSEESTTVTYYWMTKEIKIGVNSKMAIANPLYKNGLEGFPLKMVAEFDGVVLTQEVTEISKKKVNASFFKIPGGYTTKDYSESPFGSAG